MNYQPSDKTGYHVVATVLLASLVVHVEQAHAHGSERGLVMLLPTAHYRAGGALAIAASFLLLALAPPAWAARYASAAVRVGRLPAITPAWTSLVSFALMCGLLVAGSFGPTDPLANPLPLFTWTLWWVGLILAISVIGNVWTHVNPWSGPVRFTQWLCRLPQPVFRWPTSLGYTPALVIFFAFAWLELVHPSPDDPSTLVGAVLAYWLFVYVCMLLFGEHEWTRDAEPFSVFFRLIGACAPLSTHRDSTESRSFSLRLTWPGARFLSMPALGFSGVLFVLLTLSSVSFDGFSKTFFWLSIIDVNPLEYPGRTAMVSHNTWGLLLAFLVLAAMFFSAVWMGCTIAGRRDLFGRACGRLIYSMIPISLVFHIAHYLTLLLVNGQYSILSMNDPWGRGWDLFGFKGAHVTTSFLNNINSVETIWFAQTAIIVIGHVAGIVVAHGIAIRLFASPAAATRSQIPLAALMVAYTVFGLWLLSTASIG